MAVDQRRPKKLTPKGTPPMPSSKPPVPGSGRGIHVVDGVAPGATRPAQYYNPDTKQWIHT